MIVLVLTTPRSGSSWFCSTYLVHGSPDLTPVYPGYVHVGEMFTRMSSVVRESAAQFLIKGGSNCVVKLFPHHVPTADPNTPSVLVSASEKIYVLVRKDFNAQLRSMYIAEQTDYYFKENLPKRTVRYSAADYLRNKEFLQESLVKLSEIWRKLPHAELVYLEDLPRSGKYCQPVAWDQEPPRIEFNTESLFA